MVFLMGMLDGMLDGTLDVLDSLNSDGFTNSVAKKAKVREGRR
jgi:hypothetical protein